MTANARSALHIAVGKGHTEIVKLLGKTMEIYRGRRSTGRRAEIPPEPTFVRRQSNMPDIRVGDVQKAEGLCDVSTDLKTKGAEDILNCPITKAIMHEPVVAPDGHTYEKDAITSWLRSHGKSPVTQQPMSVAALIPNLVVKHQIETRSRKNLGEDNL